MRTTSAIAADAALPVIPGYRIVRLLSRGGMGSVYLAQQTALGRTVALKVLRPDPQTDPDFRSRFQREARVAATIEHPAVVRVHDAGEIDGVFYLAMAYLPGGDLAGRIQRDGPLPEAEALVLAGRIAEALGVLHAAGIIHRDVKPENMLLDAQGRPVLADLGSARQSDGGDRLTQTGAALGTPAYMAPEQAAGRSELDARADIYALGASLHTFVIGRPPYAEATAWATVAAHLHRQIPDPRLAAPGLSDAASAIIVHCLQKNPSDRYQTAAALREDLSAAASGQPLRHAKPLPSRSPAPAAAARLPWAATLATVALGGLLALVIAGMLEDETPPAVRQPIASSTIPSTHELLAAGRVEPRPAPTEPLSTPATPPATAATPQERRERPHPEPEGPPRIPDEPVAAAQPPVSPAVDPDPVAAVPEAPLRHEEAAPSQISAQHPATPAASETPVEAAMVMAALPAPAPEPAPTALNQAPEPDPLVVTPATETPDRVATTIPPAEAPPWLEVPAPSIVETAVPPREEPAAAGPARDADAKVYVAPPASMAPPPTEPPPTAPVLQADGSLLAHRPLAAVNAAVAAALDAEGLTWTRSGTETVKTYSGSFVDGKSFKVVLTELHPERTQIQLSGSMFGRTNRIDLLRGILSDALRR